MQERIRESIFDISESQKIAEGCLHAFACARSSWRRALQIALNAWLVRPLVTWCVCVCLCRTCGYAVRPEASVKSREFNVTSTWLQPHLDFYMRHIWGYMRHVWHIFIWNCLKSNSIFYNCTDMFVSNPPSGAWWGSFHRCSNTESYNLKSFLHQPITDHPPPHALLQREFKL